MKRILLLLLFLVGVQNIEPLHAQTPRTTSYLQGKFVSGYTLTHTDISDWLASYLNLQGISANNIAYRPVSGLVQGLYIPQGYFLGRDTGAASIGALPFSRLMGGGSYMAGAGIRIASNIISADSNLAIWNANWLHNKLISATAPTSGQVLKWNSGLAEWAPAADTGIYVWSTGLTNTTGTITANTGTALWNANKLQGKAISPTAPSSNQVLKWNAGLSEWIPATDTGVYTFGSGVSLSGTTVTGNYSGGAGITISGATISGQTTSALWNGNKLQGVAISPTSPSNHQVLKYNSGLSEWTAATDTGITSIDSTHTHWNANKLLGRKISPMAPTDNQVLKWNNGLSEWTPATDTGIYTFGNGLTLSGTTVTGNYQGDGSTINVVSNTISCTLVGDGTTILVSGNTISGLYAAGTGITITSGSIAASNSTALWNASQLQGVNVSSGGPSDGQVLQYNAGGSQWQPTTVSTIQSGDLMLKSTSAPDISEWTQHSEITLPLNTPGGYFWYMKN